MHLVTFNRIFLISVLLFFTTACGTLQVGIYKTPTPDSSAIATLASMMLAGTQHAQRATEINNPPTPTPPVGFVKGRICYPSDRIPVMTAYFVNLDNKSQFELGIQAGQSEYNVEIPPGNYYAYAWVSDYKVGGMYSQYVACGMTESCTDHTPASFVVTAGTTVGNIDLCDWGILPAALPVPPGFKLP